MARSDMRDFEWDFIEKLLPNNSRGVNLDSAVGTRWNSSKLLINRQ